MVFSGGELSTCSPGVKGLLNDTIQIRSEAACRSARLDRALQENRRLGDWQASDSGRDKAGDLYTPTLHARISDEISLTYPASDAIYDASEHASTCACRNH